MINIAICDDEEIFLQKENALISEYMIKKGQGNLKRRFALPFCYLLAWNGLLSQFVTCHATGRNVVVA